MEFITDRLVIRAFKPTDGDDLYDYLSDEEVVRYEPYGVQSREMCEKEASSRSKNDCFLAVVLRSEDKVIGNLYYKQIEPSKVNTYEVGYVFNRSYHGLGYATESLKALVGHIFHQEKAHRIIAMCNTDNSGSWKLLERVGFRREATRIENMYFDWDDFGNPLWFDSYQYAILKKEHKEKK